MTVVAATPDRWDDLAAVFGTRGDPPRCWCQWFRHDRPGFASVPPSGRRDDLQASLADDPPPGVLAYVSGTPAGWCAVAPRADYQRLLSYPLLKGTSDADGLWAVTCFVVRPTFRRGGLTDLLLDGALALARSHGAAAAEAYPVDTSVRTVMANELRHGPLSTFLRAGFREVSRPSAARAIVRREL